MGRTERAARGMLANIIQYVLQIVLQLLLAPVVLLIAGQEVLGTYAILIQIIGYLVLLDLGFSYALSRYLSYSTGLDDEGQYFRKVINTGYTFLLVVGLLYGLATTGLALNLEKIIKLNPAVASQARIATLMLAGWGLIRFPLSIFRNALNANQDLAFINLISAFSNAVRLVMSLGLVYLGFGLCGLVGGNIIGEIADIFLCRWRFKRTLAWAYPNLQSLRWDVLKELFVFGLQGMVIIIADRLIFFTDSIVVGYLFGAVAASIYFTTQMPAVLGYNLIFRLCHNVGPALNELYARNEKDRLQTAYLKLLRYTWLLVLPFAVGVIAMLGNFVKLWVGAEQFAGNLMAIWLALFACVTCTRFVGSAILIAKGSIGGLTIISLIEGVTNLGLSFWLGRTMGLPGVALATLIASLISLSYAQYRVKSELMVSNPTLIRRCVMPAIGITLVYTVILLWARNLFPPVGWGPFGLVIGLAGATWVLAMITWGLESSERDLLRALVQGTLGKFSPFHGCV